MKFKFEEGNGSTLLAVASFFGITSDRHDIDCVFQYIVELRRRLAWSSGCAAPFKRNPHTQCRQYCKSLQFANIDHVFDFKFGFKSRSVQLVKWLLSGAFLEKKEKDTSRKSSSFPER